MAYETVLWGDIYIVNLGEPFGSEQGGVRPALVIQNNIGNQHSPTTMIVPITSQSKTHLPVHVEIGRESGLPKDSIALFEQIQTIDKRRIGRYIGRLDPSKIPLVDRAIHVSLSALSA
jgi:mRNA interferase MazF